MALPPAPANSLMTLDAEIRVAPATVQLARFHVHEPADTLRAARDSYWLDLCLSPRPQNARACYREHWSPRRFERIGKLALLPARQTVQVRSEGGPSQTSVLCHLHPERLQAWFDGELQWTDRRLTAALDIQEPHMRALLLRIAEELRQPGFASEALIELLVGQLAIELQRYCTSVQASPASGGLAGWRLQRIDELLKETDTAPNLTTLARHCGLSVRQLTRAFRASRGQSLGSYIADTRIARARQMLLDGQSVKAVAYSLGFATPSGFCFAFRRATGQTPREFRVQSLRDAA